MDKERKIKEIQYQETYHLIRTLKRFNSDWKSYKLDASGCIINITTLGGKANFECYIDGWAFDNHILPALEKALQETLARKKEFLKIQIGEIDNILNKKK